MTRYAVMTATALAAALAAATPAVADYTIDEDAAFPSVVYINFDPATMPKVLMAPSARDLGLSVIDGGMSPDQTNPDKNASDDKPDDKSEDDQNRDNTSDDKTASTGTLDQRVDDKFNEIINDQQKFEDMITDYEIEDRLREESQRLLQ